VTDKDKRDCDLCGLPVPPKGYGVRTATRDLAFCCEGCREIWRMLNADEAKTCEQEKENT